MELFFGWGTLRVIRDVVSDRMIGMWVNCGDGERSWWLLYYIVDIKY